MDCPKCKSEETQVIDSRDTDTRNIRRRRECEKCRYRFTTYEKVEQIRLMVEKRNGRVEPFEREKIIRGIEIAANGRLTAEEADGVADEIEQKLLEGGEQTASSVKIGNLVIRRLKKIDEIAYLRFTSVYKDFKNIESFEEELTRLKK